jgi:choline transport protein
LILCLHIGGFVAILVPLWVLGPKGESDFVWTTFLDEGQWGSLGVACLVGMLTPTTAFLGADAAVHMSEELKNASKVLPRAMIWTSVVNGAMGFVMLM